MAVLVLDKRKKPLMPCSEKRARLLLERGRARVHRMVPFTIRLVDRLQEDSDLQPVRLKLDHGSKTTGMALVREKEIVDASTGEILRTLTVLILLELQHRGHAIRDALTSRRAFRRRRRGNLRYRAPRFNNRPKPEGWLAPSLQHRVDTTLTWVKRLMRWVPVTALSHELVRFDAQRMHNPEISGVEYQQGELQGYEVREYLLEKWGRKCAYCDAENVPLEVDHIHPRSKGGSNRVSNLTLACHDCNQRKGNLPIEAFLAQQPERLRCIQAQSKETLRDAAAMNSTRWALFRRLEATNLPVEAGSGGRTKWNRTRQGYPKTHWIDAACVGVSGEAVTCDPEQVPLRMKAMGHGERQRARLDAHGFPAGHKSVSKSAYGFQTGDMVKAHIPKGKFQGVHYGRVAIRSRPSFALFTPKKAKPFDVHPKYLTIVHRSDGYVYNA